MDRLTACYITVVLLLVVFVVSAFSGIVLWLALPSGDGQHGRGAGTATAEGEKTFLGLERGNWKALHTYSSLATIVLSVVHMAFNWRWFVSATKKVFK